MLAASLSLLLSLSALSSALQVMTLEECDRRGLQFCFTGDSDYRAELNAAIEANSGLRRELDTDLRPSAEELDEISGAAGAASPRFRRNVDVPRNESRTDCTSVCCAVVNTTAPFSYFKEKDGWARVASTPEYPQRTAFRQEFCNIDGERCNNVRSAKTGFIPRCQTTYRTHYIWVFKPSKTSRAPEIFRREVDIAQSCRCELTPVRLTRNRNNNRLRRSALDMVELFDQLTHPQSLDDDAPDDSAAPEDDLDGVEDHPQLPTEGESPEDRPW